MLASFKQINSTYIQVLTQRRNFKANGKDSAEVNLFLVDDLDELEDNDSIEVAIVPTHGEINPDKLYLSKNKPAEVAKLVCRDVARVTFRIVTNPNMKVENEEEVTFVPPVTFIECTSSPNQINFLDRSDVLVRLLDENKNPLRVQQAWPVTLEISAGGGRVTPRTIEIQPNTFESEARFTPASHIGTTIIKARVNSLPSATHTITITWPIMIIITSVVGGLVGGLISYFSTSAGNKKIWRVFTGLFTGLVLYWAIVFFLPSDFDPAILLNVLSVFVISLAGGYIGVGSIDFVLSRFGVKKTA